MTEFIAPPCKEQISILYQDEYILLINKPSGLLSLSGKNPLNKDSVHFRLVQDFPTATLVHRLDFGTSGIMLVALNKSVNGLLTKQFQEKTIVKYYHATLYGHASKALEDSAVINAAISKDTENFPFMKICPETGKTALSEIEIIERTYLQAFADGKSNLTPVTRVRFKPITGRTHQLRIHSQYIGHPILGCDLYCNEDSQTLAPRLLLHASNLSFTHPVTFEPFEIKCEVPF
ncbi:pseudouridine synthase [Shewanella goraebulensis]|uniref:pseudouridine synthase n=1 Tax=Shewanella goraebulensis TaxID=3050637 RepID=UPI00254B6A7D|nr:pseudouridine synthase [Shewanella goraebulensis]